MTPEMNLGGDRTMNWFFDQFVYGTEIPHYLLEYKIQPTGTDFALDLKVIQSGVSDKFRMNVPIYAETNDGRIARFGVAKLTGNSTQSVNVKLASRPKHFLLCAYEDVLAIIDGQ